MGLHQKAIDERETFGVQPVAGRIGAVITGVELSGDLSREQATKIRETLLRHKVVFFRDEHHLDDAKQEAFARLLGDLFRHPTIPQIEGTESVFNVFSDGTYAANTWHTDMTFMEAYPQASILRAVHLPAKGGDTMWANTAAAYLDMPEPLRIMADTLWVMHSNAYDYTAIPRGASEGLEKYFRDSFAAKVYETEHPLVRVHPETGERTLVLGGFAQKILGFNRDDSARLFNIFQDHITRLENTVRWHWAPGDVAIWDNRATQHYGIGDYTESRELHRVTLEGDVPVGVDGTRSVSRVRIPPAVPKVTAAA